MERLKPRPILYHRWWGRDEPIIRAILNNRDYQNCQTYREQCHVLYKLGRGYFLTKNFMAKLLGIDHKSFEKQLSLPLESRPPGRPSLLNEEEKREVFTEITRLIDEQQYPTVRDVQQIIIEKCEKVVSVDTVHRMIESSDMFKIIQGDPMEEARANVSQTLIDDYYRRLSEAINGIPASLVFNIDEAGEDDYVDMHAYQVIVKDDFEGNHIPIPVKRELLSEEDRELIRLARERLTEPGSIPVKLEDL